MHGMTEQLFDGTLVKQFLDVILVQTPSDTAKGVSYLVVRPAYILDLKVLPAIAATNLCLMASKLGVVKT